MSRLLIVEDYAELANLLTDILEKKHQVTHAANLTAAKKFLAIAEFDLLILDVSLPDGSGFDLYEYVLKEQLRKVPVIFLTGQSDLTNRMKGLELGAQDYILKPFYAEEFLLRVEMRLQQFENQSNMMTCGDLKFEKNLQRIFLVKDQAPVQDLNLTPNEYKILSLLVANKGEVVSRSKIVDCVWGPGFSLSDKAVNSHISNLRKKIQSTNCKITASKGNGYILKVIEQVKD